ncbi:hypothetical protein [Burkholderia pseudomallei]|uniref:hypothetical protein n=2 Tax=Burkholderia pseudomallei TaxID=28450 RepID=UPI0010386264|nr:hypothetical protein [Burkholderia pseudomallei]MBD2915974.1 hypothetical protein [Burkholderia pseudomallei]MBD2928325.1 hypothetical protein [Burkholderia pseudomallei]MBD2934514.1 hypothetical protein [Burkholderia pseudomallei]MBD2971372.1 hypothetical protein [Burkholderia pseudomallei]MBF3384449.1 hypothetical protein [Burkholderia pseudomallei]
MLTASWTRNAHPGAAMDRIVKPGLDVQGGKAVSKAGSQSTDSRSDRLLKYIQPDVAGFYAVAQGAIHSYDKAPLSVLPTYVLALIVFVLCLTACYWLLRRQFVQKGINGSTRYKMLLPQLAVTCIAFTIWSYAINSFIWDKYYNSAVAFILSGVFILFAGDYRPKISLDEARKHGFTAKDPNAKNPQ